MENKIILYHGSPNKFKKFKLPNKNTKFHCPNSYHAKVIYFTDDKDYVKNYGSGGYTYTCEVTIKKLLKLHEMQDEQEFNSLEQEFTKLYPDKIFNYRDNNYVITFLKSKGYNGMIRTDGSHLTYLMFDPKDIKILEY